MKEILPGVHHWTRVHPKIKIEVSSYYLAPHRALLDPLVPAEGIEAFEPTPEHILLTNRHHYRDSGAFVERYGCTVWCVDKGMHEFKQGEAVRPFRFGDVLLGGIAAVEVGVICPDETAFHIPAGEGVVALADGVVRSEDGALGFVPDAFMGKDPEAIKAGLREAYRRLLPRDFDHLLLAHGWPWVGGGKRALEAFISER